MKPFDLQAALAGAKVITRDGREVKIAGYNEDLNSVVGWVDSSVFCWTGGGSGQVNQLDLFMAPIERKEWVVRGNVRAYGNMFSPGLRGPFKSIKDAEKCRFDDFQADATIHEITIHE